MTTSNELDLLAGRVRQGDRGAEYQLTELLHPQLARMVRYRLSEWTPTALPLHAAAAPGAGGDPASLKARAGAIAQALCSQVITRLRADPERKLNVLDTAMRWQECNMTVAY